MLDEANVFAMPAIPIEPFEIDPDLSRVERIGRSLPIGKNTTPFDLTHYPAVSVPCGTSYRRTLVGLKRSVSYSRRQGELRYRRTLVGLKRLERSTAGTWNELLQTDPYRSSPHEGVLLGTPLANDTALLFSKVSRFWFSLRYPNSCRYSRFKRVAPSTLELHSLSLYIQAASDIWLT